MIQKRFFGYVLLICLLLSSCATNNQDIRYRVLDCPANIREDAVSYARKYFERETEFAWGGRDALEKEGILALDCSGFIVRVYQYAVKGTKYSLLFDDAPVSGFYHHFTAPVDTLSAGDIIFMGTDKDLPPTHMSIFVNMDSENIYFFDATEKEEEGINGVTFRYYPKDDPRFISYARLLIKY
ncbi:MAG: NlpC/P60 family protein [Treponema sp.]|nr:NlpC/P60 family protein [Treponema sp.]